MNDNLAYKSMSFVSVYGANSMLSQNKSIYGRINSEIIFLCNLLLVTDCCCVSSFSIWKKLVCVWGWFSFENLCVLFRISYRTIEKRTKGYGVLRPRVFWMAHADLGGREAVLIEVWFEAKIFWNVQEREKNVQEKTENTGSRECSTENRPNLSKDLFSSS